MSRSRATKSYAAAGRRLVKAPVEPAPRPPKLEVRLLGPLEIAVDARPVMLTSPRLRALLVALATCAGRPVSASRLADAVWPPEEAPHDAGSTIHTYVCRLRSSLGAATIVTTASGYQLSVPPDSVDALRFVRLLDTAASATDPTGEREALGAALRLWRGAPFDGVRSVWLDETAAPQLVERYLAAVERRIDLDSASGQHVELVAELLELTSRYPLRESLWVRLIRLLNQVGRPAEALEAYETVRSRIAEELGVDPGPELRRAYADLLAGTAAVEPGHDPVASPAAKQVVELDLVGLAVRSNRPAGAVVPRQLPAAISGFVDRRRELSIMDEMVRTREGAERAVPIAVITGPAGVGKTTLAVHWAHRVVHEFPDGQLHVDLRGAGSSGAEVAPGEALRLLLEGLGVLAGQLPPQVEARSALFRSLVADKRVLVVLDNARDTDQLIPLLPGGPGCLVVITSRDELTSLVATTGARPLPVDRFTIAQARQLLSCRLGASRVDADPVAAEEIIRATARLPLALATIAARL
ncbi:MAG TPA: BTAD domain-containing putative transcriptional regulator, partial [Micromonosporaceae bacterium]